MFLLNHEKLLIAFGDESFKFLTCQLSMVVYWPTMPVTGNGLLGATPGNAPPGAGDRNRDGLLGATPGNAPQPGAEDRNRNGPLGATGKHTASGSLRLPPKIFYLPDRNPVRQSPIRKKNKKLWTRGQRGPLHSNAQHVKKLQASICTAAISRVRFPEIPNNVTRAEARHHFQEQLWTK